jgi:hypothetical protein
MCYMVECCVCWSNTLGSDEHRCSKNDNQTDKGAAENLLRVVTVEGLIARAATRFCQVLSDSCMTKLEPLTSPPPSTGYY